MALASACLSINRVCSSQARLRHERHAHSTKTLIRGAEELALSCPLYRQALSMPPPRYPHTLRFRRQRYPSPSPFHSLPCSQEEQAALAAATRALEAMRLGAAKGAATATGGAGPTRLGGAPGGGMGRAGRSALRSSLAASIRELKQADTARKLMAVRGAGAGTRGPQQCAGVRAAAACGRGKGGKGHSVGGQSARLRGSRWLGSGVLVLAQRECERGSPRVLAAWGGGVWRCMRHGGLGTWGWLEGACRGYMRGGTGAQWGQRRKLVSA